MSEYKSSNRSNLHMLILKRILVLLIIFSITVCSISCKTNSSSSSSDTGSSSSSEMSVGDSSGSNDDHEHNYSARSYTIATCTKEGTKAHYECTVCGKLFVLNGERYVETTAEALAMPKFKHKYTREVPDEKYFVSEATEDTPRVFKKSCVCGAVEDGDAAQTFTAGKALKEYQNVDKTFYKPTSLTVTLYDAADCVYGFTWNTVEYPAMATVEYCEGNTITDSNQKAIAVTEEVSSYALVNNKDEKITYYVTKARVKLKPDTVYTYRVGDGYLGVQSEDVTIKTVKPATEKFRFAHVSDSQSGTIANGKGTGEYYRRTLSAIANDGSDFIVHTGDVVEYSKYESFWTEMLDSNFEYLSKIPVMAIAGNHETTYFGRAGESETYKHFYYNTPEQDVAQGFYYSFSYGNVKFIMLNTNRLLNDRLTTDQYKWLESELKNKTEKWTIVTLHNPIYSVGKYGADPSHNGTSVVLKSQLADLFARAKVDIVLQGHDHCVSRTFPIGVGGVVAAEIEEDIGGIKYTKNPDGVLYLMNGPAGNQARTITACDENIYAYGQKSNICSWAEFDVEGDAIIVSVKYYDGGVKEYCKWGIKKTA